MRTLLFILLLAVLAIGTDAVMFNGSYSQGIWRTISQYTVEIRGPSEQPSPPPPAPGPAENRPNPG